MVAQTVMVGVRRRKEEVERREERREDAGVC